MPPSRVSLVLALKDAGSVVVMVSDHSTRATANPPVAYTIHGPLTYPKRARMVDCQLSLTVEFRRAVTPSLETKTAAVESSPEPAVRSTSRPASRFGRNRKL